MVSTGGLWFGRKGYYQVLSQGWRINLENWQNYSVTVGTLGPGIIFGKIDVDCERSQNI